MDDKEYWDRQIAITTEFLNLCPPDLQNYVVGKINKRLNEHPDYVFTQEDKNLWDRLIASNPILQRVIFYTYSVPEDIDTRRSMLQLRGVKLPFEDRNCIHFVKAYPEIRQSSLLTDFLNRMLEDFDRVLHADVQIAMGSKEPVEVLRYEAFSIERDGEGKITKVVWKSPWDRKELHLLKKKLDVYILDKSQSKGAFEIDEFLINWMHLFADEKSLREEAYSDDLTVRIFEKDGKLARPPKGKINPFMFSLKERYQFLMKKIQKKYDLDRHIEIEKFDKETKKIIVEKDVIDRSWDLEEIFKKAIMEWNGKIVPPAYFEQALKRGFLNLEKSFRKRFIEKKDLEESGIHPEYPNSLWRDDDSSKKESKFVLTDNLDTTGGSLDDIIEYDEEDDGTETRRIDRLSSTNTPIDEMFDIGRFMETLKDEVDKIIFSDYCEAIRHDEKPSMNTELAEMIKKDLKIKLSPQRVGQRRDKIIENVRKFFS